MNEEAYYPGTKVKITDPTFWVECKNCNYKNLHLLPINKCPTCSDVVSCKPVTEREGNKSMQTIELSQMQICNFKGIKELTIDFKKVTSIKADNAKGKSTIFDAFCWVLFGKDSHGNSKFHIRPITSSGNDIDYIDISVIITLLINGRATELKKVQKQKWVKKRGSENQTFEGNVNEYEWNGFPKSEADFNSTITDIITDAVFMMVTNPAYFPSMKWKDQREALMKLVPEIKDEDVVLTNTKFLPLVEMLKENTIDAWKDKYSKALKEYNKQIDTIPNRIDEVSRNIKEVDYSAEELKLQQLKTQLNEVEGQIEDTSKSFDEVLNINQEIFNLKGKILVIENDAKTEHEKGIKKLQSEKDRLDNEFNIMFAREGEIKRTLLYSKDESERSQKELENIRAKFLEVENEVMGVNDLNCPTCGQALPEEKASTISEDFKNSKNNRLLSIRNQGINLNKKIAELKQEVDALEAEQQEIIAKKTIVVGETNRVMKQIEEYPKLNLLDIPVWVELGAQCKELEYKLSTIDDGKEITNILKSRRSNIQTEIDEVNKTLNNKAVIESAKQRVDELKSEQKGIAQQVADSEKMIFLFEEFIKAKMDMLSGAINSKFEVVNWKLFETQINGGLKETCELTVNGVPYEPLNSAAKVQAGLDIINTMSKIYDVSAPIFIDNREGVNDIPGLKGQVINLIVLPKAIPADIEIIL